jgi:hypothetical protein
MKDKAFATVHHTMMPILFHWEAYKWEQKIKSLDPLIKARFPETALDILAKLLTFPVRC